MTEDTPSFEPLGSGYLLETPIGSGAMGQVWRGRTHDGDPVAIKVLRPELGGDPTVVARFVQEAQILKRLDDPHLVRVRDLVAEGSRLAIVMDLVEGPDLRTELARRGTFRPIEAAEIVDGVLAGLAAVHAGGVVHRDVKPENVLLQGGLPSGTRLTDFGVARLVEASEKARRTTVIGTPEYLAPEVADGAEPTPASDLYAVGILLYELVAGVTPFAGGSPLAVLRRHADQQPVRPPGMPDAIWEVVWALLAKDPAQRPANAPMVRERLAAVAASFVDAPAAAPLSEPPAAVVAAQPTVHGLRGETAEMPVVTEAAAPGPAGNGRRRGLIIAAVALVVLLGIGGGVAAVALTGNSHDPVATGTTTPSTTEDVATTTETATSATSTTPSAGGTVVPSVVGQSFPQAQTALQSAGFQVKATYEPDSGAPDGSVTAQDPAANASVAAGSTVTLTVVKNSTGDFLSTLQPVGTGQGTDWAVGAATVNAKPYAQAIVFGTRCNDKAVVQYNLGRAYQTLTGIVGLRDDSSSDALVQFDVIVDDKPVFTQQAKLGQDIAVNVPVAAGLRMDLQVTRVEKSCDDYNKPATNAVWANMQLTR
jgi:serine/threonine-protein kinase